MIRAAGAAVSTPAAQAGDPGSNPRAALHLSPRDLQVRVIPPQVAAEVVRREHYLHSAPAAIKRCFGVFAAGVLKGVAIFTTGPINAFRLVEGATRDDCWTLARLWLSDDLPRNSESRVVAVILRALRRYTAVKFILSYADPAVDHSGVPHLGYVYQACNFVYAGRSESQPLMSVGGGPFRHTRSISSVAGTHSTAFFRRQGLSVRLQTTDGKHRYVYFVDPSWRDRLLVPVLPYPKKGVVGDGGR